MTLPTSRREAVWVVLAWCHGHNPRTTCSQITASQAAACESDLVVGAMVQTRALSYLASGRRDLSFAIVEVHVNRKAFWRTPHLKHLTAAAATTTSSSAATSTPPSALPTPVEHGRWRLRPQRTNGEQRLSYFYFLLFLIMHQSSCKFRTIYAVSNSYLHAHTLQAFEVVDEMRKSLTDCSRVAATSLLQHLSESRSQGKTE